MLQAGLKIVFNSTTLTIFTLSSEKVLVLLEIDNRYYLKLIRS